MPDDLDIYRSANLLLKQYGETADLHAAERADALLAAGDVAGQLVWMRILRAINALRAPASCDDPIN